MKASRVRTKLDRCLVPVGHCLLADWGPGVMLRVSWFGGDVGRLRLKEMRVLGARRCGRKLFVAGGGEVCAELGGCEVFRTKLCGR